MKAVRNALLFSVWIALVSSSVHAKRARTKPRPVVTIPAVFWGEWAEDKIENCTATNAHTRIILGPRRFYIQGDEVAIASVKVHNQNSVTVFGSSHNGTYATFDYLPEKDLALRDSEVSMHRCPKGAKGQTHKTESGH